MEVRIINENTKSLAVLKGIKKGYYLLGAPFILSQENPSLEAAISTVTFKTTALINQWRFELSMKIQKVNETVEQYSTNIKKLIRRINDENRLILKGIKKGYYLLGAPFILSQENPSLEAAISTANLAINQNLIHDKTVLFFPFDQCKIAKQFKENTQTYPEAMVGCGTTTCINPQRFMPSCDKNRNREDVIERIVQKALAPIVEKLQRITERDERSTHTSYKRPNYNNDIRGQNTWNHNNNANDPFCCFFCGQSGHITKVCPIRVAQIPNNLEFGMPKCIVCPTKQGNPGNSTILLSREPARVAQPQANVTTNQSKNQIQLNGANGNTFVI
ncbi:hypothetical protein Glove_66g29 [Diversispora epigaea]|uniref:CCHC-type domain-containing protein n=1 Tax=Diversispora epigaea TaxID=1348612 RepID=A0A397JAM4_9GLOM|nr:hypothetical protein Glove_66g29 [Diversispora epigaea]